MSFVRFLILAVAAAIGGLFWIQNRDVLSEYVRLTLNLAFFKVEFIPLRVDAVVGIGFVIGFVVSYWVSLVPRIKSYFHVRKLEKMVHGGEGVPSDRRPDVTH